jgi:hypothetical protein
MEMLEVSDHVAPIEHVYHALPAWPCKGHNTNNIIILSELLLPPTSQPPLHIATAPPRHHRLVGPILDNNTFADFVDSNRPARKRLTSYMCSSVAVGRPCAPFPAILGMVEAAPVPPPKSSFRPVYWYWTMAIRTIRSALNSETHLVIVYMAMRSALKCRSAVCILSLLVMEEIKKVAS